MKKFLREYPLFAFVAVVLILGAIAYAQQTSGNSGQSLAPQPSWNTPDCVLYFKFTTAGRSQPLDNRLTGCSTWHLTYFSNGWTTVSLSPQQAPDSSGSAGSWSNWPAAQTQGTTPLTATTFTQVSFFSFAPWVSVNAATLSGGSNQFLQGVLLGWRAQGASESSNGAQVVQGIAGEGTTSVGNPVSVGGKFETSPTVLTNGQQGTLQQDANQNLLVKINAGLTNNNAVPGANNVGVLPNLANAANPTFTEGDQTLGSVDLSGNLRVKVNAALPAGTATIGGVTGTLTNNNAAPAATNNLGVLPNLANAANPTFTEGDLTTGSVDLRGGTRIVGDAVDGTTSTPNGIAIGGNNSGTYRTLTVAGSTTGNHGTGSNDLEVSAFGYSLAGAPGGNAWAPNGFDPCANTAIAKSHVFKNITTATTTALVAASGSTNIYVCGIDVELSSSTASTVLFEHGTGATCGSGTTSDTATYTNAAVPLIFHLGFGGITYFATGASQAECAVSTVGTGPAISVDMTYVQQ